MSHLISASCYVRDTHCCVTLISRFFCIYDRENFKLKGNWAEPAFDMQPQPDFESESMRELPLLQKYY